MYGLQASQERRSGSEEVSVYMAGDIDHAKQIVRRFCMNEKTCVTVSPTTYIYSGGEEAGFVVAFRNYPRFPSTAESLASKAAGLANLLRKELGQKSFMVVSDEGTTWIGEQK